MNQQSYNCSSLLFFLTFFLSHHFVSLGRTAVDPLLGLFLCGALPQVGRLDRSGRPGRDLRGAARGGTGDHQRHPVAWRVVGRNGGKNGAIWW